MKKKVNILSKFASRHRFGTDPTDPWSPKANIPDAPNNIVKEDEEGHKSLIQQYLLAKGFDPRFTTKEKIMALGKSDDFLRWKQENFGTQMEEKKTLNDIKSKIRKKDVPVNDPFIGIDPKANMTRVAEDSSQRKRELSKSARIIKAIYKRKGIKEELYDHEKDKKEVKNLGSGTPKMIDGSKNKGSKKLPQASAVLVGGKTMTGKDRDIIEIDPVMNNKLMGNKKK